MEYFLQKKFKYLQNKRMFIYICCMRVKDEAKREQISRATMRLVNEGGFQGASMARIAQQADVSAATIYLYFENKEDLINKLYLEIKQRMSQVMLMEYDAKGDVKENIKKLWFHFYGFITDHPDQFQFIEQCTNSPLIREENKAESMTYYANLFGLFERGRSTGAILPVSDELIYVSLFAPISQLAKHRLRLQQPLTEKEAGDVFEAAWRAVGSREFESLRI